MVPRAKYSLRHAPGRLSFIPVPPARIPIITAAQFTASLHVDPDGENEHDHT